MAPFGYSIWLWLKANPWIAAIGAGLVFLKLRDNRLETKHRREEREEVINSIEEDAHERIEAVRDAEDRITRDLNERSLRELTETDPNNRFGMQ